VIKYSYANDGGGCRRTPEGFTDDLGGEHDGEKDGIGYGGVVIVVHPVGTRHRHVLVAVAVVVVTLVRSFVRRTRVATLISCFSCRVNKELSVSLPTNQPESHSAFFSPIDLRKSVLLAQKEQENRNRLRHRRDTAAPTLFAPETDISGNGAVTSLRASWKTELATTRKLIRNAEGGGRD